MKENKNGRRQKVMIVDDHTSVCLGLADLIGNQPGLTVCGAAAGAADAMAMLKTAKPDLALVDLTLADGSGIELIKEIHSHSRATLVLVVSMHDEMLYAERALRAGAKGYICKTEPVAKLLEAIRAVLGGKVYLSDAMTHHMIDLAVRPSGDLIVSAIESLSDRELEVFEQIGDGLTTQQIARRLFLSSKTVETYREHIKTKFKITTSGELVCAAMKWQLQRK